MFPSSVRPLRTTFETAGRSTIEWARIGMLFGTCQVLQKVKWIEWLTNYANK
jgi:hypothetical protein